MANTTKKTESLKYADLLGQSQSQKDAQELQFQVEESQQQLDADILSTKRNIASAKKNLLRVKSTYPLNSQNIVNAQIAVEEAEEGLKRLEALREELF